MTDRDVNWRKLPLVLLIRVPILLPLWLVYRAGKGAEWLYEHLSPYLPGLDP